MVMEASPSPQSVGREFVRQYYTLLNKAPAHLHRFYNNHSSFVHGGLDAPNRETLPVVGQKQIHNRIQQLNFRDCHAKISQVDSQATLGNGVVVQVTGELSNGGAPMRRFTQTFVLAAQSPKKYYVHNDIFRYQDIVFSDEEGEGSGRSEGEDEEPAGTGAGGGAGYFPPPPAAFPSGGGFPAPPAHTHAPLVSPPPAAVTPVPVPVAAAAPPAASAPAPAPHLNGHPPQHDDSTRHLVAALQGNALPGVVNELDVDVEPASLPAAPEPSEPVAAVAEAAPDSEPEREPTPPPHQPQPQPAVAPAPTEPKTYANLLKSGGGSGGGGGVGGAGSGGVGGGGANIGGGVGVPQMSRGSPPAATHPPPAEQRSRPPRAPRDSQPPSAEGRSGGGGGGGGPRCSDSQQLFLGNLPHSATEEELRALFAQFGPVAELRVHGKPAAPGAPRHPNYGFITYENSQSAHDCLNAAPLYFPPDSADGVKLNVEEKKTRGREPPRRRPLSSHRGAPFQPRPQYRR